MYKKLAFLNFFLFLQIAFTQEITLDIKTIFPDSTVIDSIKITAFLNNQIKDTAITDSSGYAHLVIDTTVTSIFGKRNIQPQTIELYSNYPNPFNGETTIPFEVNKAQQIKIEIYDILGRRVKTVYVGHLLAGSYNTTWSGQNDFGKRLAPGIYFFKLNNKARKMVYFGKGSFRTTTGKISGQNNLKKQSFTTTGDIIVPKEITLTFSDLKHRAFSDTLSLSTSDTTFFQIMQPLPKKHNVIIQPQTPDGENLYSNIAITLDGKKDYTKLTNETGQAIFENINADNYILKILNNPNFRKLTSNITINQDSVLTPEIFEKLNVSQTQYAMNEGGTLFLPTNTWDYALGLDSLINLSPEFQLEKVNDSTYALTTTNPDTNGNLTARIQSIANHQTKDTTNLNISIADMVNLSGKVVDVDDLMLGEENAPPIPAGIIYENKTKYLPDGTFTIKVSPQENLPIKATKIVDGDTLSWTGTFNIPANTDLDGIILHPITYKGIEGNEALFKEAYKIVNYNIGIETYLGNKFIDQTNPETNKIIIWKRTYSGVIVEDRHMNEAKAYIQERILPYVKIPMEVVFTTIDDTFQVDEGGGRLNVHIVPNESPGATAKDFDNNGTIDEANAIIRLIGGEFYYPWLLTESASGIVGPNHYYARDGLTIFEETSVAENMLQFDPKIFNIGQFYAPKEQLENMFGGKTPGSMSKAAIDIMESNYKKAVEKQKKFETEFYKIAKQNSKR